MRQCSPPVRCWSAFGSQILPLVLVINAPKLIRCLFFWAAPLLMYCAPKTFDVICSGLYRHGAIQLKSQSEIEALFTSGHPEIK